MLAIKKQFIPSYTYPYIAAGAVAFVGTFGVLSIIRPDFSAEQTTSGSSKVARQSSSDSQGNASVRTVSYSKPSQASLPDTSTVSSSSPQTSETMNPQQSSTVTTSTPSSSQSVESSSSTPPAAATPVATWPQPAVPIQESTSVQPVETTTPQPQNPSLLGGVVGGVLGVVDSVL